MKSKPAAKVAKPSRAKEKEESDEVIVKPIEEGTPTSLIVPEATSTFVAVPARKDSALDSWIPKTDLGRDVKEGRHRTIESVFETGKAILEYQITDTLLPGMPSDLLLIGQSKGKFGGGQRRVFKQTQKKTKEGNKPNFATCAVIGNSNGIVGLGYGKAKETVPAREKATRNAKLNIFQIRRGCGSWQCGCREPHSIPFKVTGKCGSIRITLLPAPQGTGLAIQKECRKVLQLAGIKDVWSQLSGTTASTVNVLFACTEALHQLMKTKIHPGDHEMLGIVEGTAPVRVENTADSKADESGNREEA
ncbi:30S ribosomal protein S5 [Candidatus Woesearchaeota archaeon]|nr:30S ribosomal protein S5 [Candidatus Woesearchaeota archaeon]